MIKKVSDKQKEEILESFLNGKKIKDISLRYNFTVPTITRQLKNLLGDQKFLEIKKNIVTKSDQKKILDSKIPKKSYKHDNSKSHVEIENNFNENQVQSFFEIAPLTQDVEFENQKDLTSIPISDAKFPNIVFMIVDRNIELDSRLLKEYAEWNFLSYDDLNRRTIKIYLDLKDAKRECKKDQKVIKVPNTNVFKIVAPILISKGISRIISANQLISL